MSFLVLEASQLDFIRLGKTCLWEAFVGEGGAPEFWKFGSHKLSNESCQQDFIRFDNLPIVFYTFLSICKIGQGQGGGGNNSEGFIVLEVELNGTTQRTATGLAPSSQIAQFHALSLRFEGRSRRRNITSQRRSRSSSLSSGRN